MIAAHSFHGDEVTSINKFSPDDSSIFVNAVSSNEIHIVRNNPSGLAVVLKNQLQGPDQQFQDSGCAAFSPDGRNLFFAAKTQIDKPATGFPRSGEVRVLDVGSLTSRQLWANFESEVKLRESQILSLAVCENYLACSSNDKNIRVLNSQTGTIVAKRELRSICDALSRSPDGTRMVIGTRGGQLMVVDLPSLEVRSSVDAHNSQISSTAWITPDLIVTGSRDHSMKLWKWTGNELTELLTLDSFSGSVDELAASADGNILALRIASETSIRLLRIDLLRQWLQECGLDW